MRILITATAVGVLSLTLTACHRHGRHGDDAGGGPLKVVAQLQCPDHQGALTRVGVSADGLSCDYTGPRGALVTLKLVKLEGQDTDAALKPIETDLSGLMPEVATKVDGAPKGDDTIKVETKTTETSGGSSHGRERADIDLPGFHVHTRDGHAIVRMPGINVDAQDDDGDGDHHSGHGAAHVSIGGGMVDVRAKDDAAIVRVHGRGDGVRSTYLLTDDTPSAKGWRMVGYEARGPASGPIVVAIVKSPDKDEKGLFEDAKRLVHANAGG
jgi:hypothetical protein